MKARNVAATLPARRNYRLGARAAAAESTGERIVEAFAAALAARPYDEIALDEVAETAGVTRQTVLRRFESKAGLLHAVGREIGKLVNEKRRGATSDDPSDAVARVVADYERTGPLLINLLMQETRSSQLHEVLDIGRLGHRRWIEGVFSPCLLNCTPAVREMRLAQLTLVTDVWTWHILRRDQQRSVDETSHIIADLVLALVRPASTAARSSRGRGTKRSRMRPLCANRPMDENP